MGSLKNLGGKMKLPKIKKDNISIASGQESVSPMKNRITGNQN